MSADITMTDADEKPPQDSGEDAPPMDKERQRFIMELEFVQCLATPEYLDYLATNRYFDNQNFINYLKYLQYWKRPEYAKYILYPHCLAFLNLLQDENFRRHLVQNSEFMKGFIHSQQGFHWQYFHANRRAEALGDHEGDDAEETGDRTGNTRPEAIDVDGSTEKGHHEGGHGNVVKAEDGEGLVAVKDEPVS